MFPPERYSAGATRLCLQRGRGGPSGSCTLRWMSRSWIRKPIRAPSNISRPRQRSLSGTGPRRRSKHLKRCQFALKFRQVSRNFWTGQLFDIQSPFRSFSAVFFLPKKQIKANPVFIAVSLRVHCQVDSCCPQYFPIILRCKEITVDNRSGINAAYQLMSFVPSDWNGDSSLRYLRGADEPIKNWEHDLNASDSVSFIIVVIIITKWWHWRNWEFVTEFESFLSFLSRALHHASLHKRWGNIKQSDP